MLFLPNNFLSVLILLPLMGGLFILQIPPAAYRNIRNCALWISFFCFCVTLLLFLSFDPRFNEYQFVMDRSWVGLFNIHFHVGVDNFALFFLLTLTALMPVVILLTSEQMKENFRSHVILELCLESFLIGSFCALDVVLFFIFAEAAIFSFLLVVNIWGQAEHKRSLYPFFITTAISSLTFLLFLLTLSDESGATTMQQFKYITQSPRHHHILCLCFIVGLLLRNGLYPFFGWFRKAYSGLTRSASFCFSVILTLGSLYYVIRFLPLVVEEDGVLLSRFIVVTVTLVFFTAVLFAITHSKPLDMQVIVPCLVQVNACFVVLSILVCDPLSQQGTVLLLVNYCFVMAGVALLRLILEVRPPTAASLREKMILLVVGTYLFLSYLGVPGTLGFWGHSLIFLGMLRQQAPLLALLQLTFILAVLWISVKWYYRTFFRVLWETNDDAVLMPLTSSPRRVPVLAIAGLVFALSVLFFLSLHQQFLLDKVPLIGENG